jgi:hypothetical protein
MIMIADTETEIDESNGESDKRSPNHDTSDNDEILQRLSEKYSLENIELRNSTSALIDRFQELIDEGRFDLHNEALKSHTAWLHSTLQVYIINLDIEDIKLLHEDLSESLPIFEAIQLPSAARQAPKGRR